MSTSSLGAGTLVANGTSVYLYRSYSDGGTDANPANWAKIWVVSGAGTASTQVGGTIYTVDNGIPLTLTSHPSSAPYDAIPLRGAGPINYIRVTASGGDVYVGFSIHG